MKFDTKDFNELPMIKGNFNTTGHGTADPFLVQMSVGHKVVAGSDIRSLKQAKFRQGKRVLGWQPDELQKAKSCDEMLAFEKSDPQAQSSWPPYHFSLPDMTVLHEFEANLIRLCSQDVN